MGRSKRKVPDDARLRESVMELLGLDVAAMPPIRCVCHGGPLHACPDRPDMFPIADEPSARAAKGRLERAVELWVIAPAEVAAVEARMDRFLPDWRRRLREEGPV
jgi:hypothetical protein